MSQRVWVRSVESRHVLEGETKQTLTATFYNAVMICESTRTDFLMVQHKHSGLNAKRKGKLQIEFIHIKNYYEPFQDSHRLIFNIALRSSMACRYHKHNIYVNNSH